MEKQSWVNYPSPSPPLVVSSPGVLQARHTSDRTWIQQKTPPGEPGGVLGAASQVEVGEVEILVVRRGPVGHWNFTFTISRISLRVNHGILMISKRFLTKYDGKPAYLLSALCGLDSPHAMFVGHVSLRAALLGRLREGDLREADLRLVFPRLNCYASPPGTLVEHAGQACYNTM